MRTRDALRERHRVEVRRRAENVLSNFNSSLYCAVQSFCLGRFRRSNGTPHFQTL
jgi:hypothetical protein